MKFTSRMISMLAVMACLFAATAVAGKRTALEASPDSCGLLVLDLKAPSRNFGLTQGMSIDGCSMAVLLSGGAAWDLGSMTTSSSIAGSLVFAAEPGRYRLFAATGSTSAGKTSVRAELSFLGCPLPQLTVEIRRGEVAYLGTVKALFHPFRYEPDIEVVLDAERQQKLLLKLADQAAGTPWGERIRLRASTEAVAADIATAGALASAPADSLPAVPVAASGTSVQAEIIQERAQRDSVMASAPRAPIAGRRPEDRLLSVGGGEKHGLIDTAGRVVVEPEFVYAGDSHEGRAMVARDGLAGYVDGTGRMVIEPKWQSAYAFVNGLAMVETGVKFGHNREIGSYRVNSGVHGWIDRDGNVVIPTQFAEAEGFSEGVAWVSDGKRWGLIDRAGRYLIEPRFERKPEHGFSSGLCPVWLGVPVKREAEPENQFGYIDTRGVIVIPAQFSAAGSFCEGSAAIMRGDRIGFIDRLGRVTIEPRFELERGQRSLPSFSEGLVPVNLAGLYGFADSSGRLVIEPRYQSAQGFREGLAAVRVDDKTGYIDREGRMVIAPRFRRVDPFEDGIARVEVSIGQWGYIRRDGSFIWNPVPARGH